MNHRRNLYLVLAIATILIGLASRRYGVFLPDLLAQYAGDTLWALVVFLGISVLLVDSSLARRFWLSLLIAFAVEFSQLYHAPWLDSVRRTTFGALVLGWGFLWTDLACYTVGILFGAAVDHALFPARER